MKWLKVISKGVFGLLTGVAAVAAADPGAITTLAGNEHAAQVGAIVGLLSAFTNWYKHRKDV